VVAEEWVRNGVWFVTGAVVTVTAVLLVIGILLESRDERARTGGAKRPVVPFARQQGMVTLAIALTLVAVSVLAVGGSPPSHGAVLAHASHTPGPATHGSSAGQAVPAPLATPSSVALPPVARGSVVRVTITAEDRTLRIAPGVRYRAWTFNGQVPGPTIHVRQGQRVVLTFRNRTQMPHSLDVHAARLPANIAFKDVAPGGVTRMSFIAGDAGVFLYHCVTAPGMAHIANGMYGAVVVDPRRALPAVDRQFVLVAGEWYLNGPGKDAPASLDWDKALSARPDLVTFNGIANRYSRHPLQVAVGARVRFYVANAGPNLVTPFHLVGGMFDRVYEDSNPQHWLSGTQTVDIPAGGGMVFDSHFETPGVYGFLSHAFSSVEKGAVGAIDVGGVHGTMTH
jgi:nitrite reductase (NO-forming)